MNACRAAAAAGILIMTTFGMFITWASPSLPLLVRDDSPVPLTVAESSWVASSLTFGAAIGSITCIYIPDMVGRKNCIVLCTLPALIGWLMIAFASTAWELYTSRFICGIGLGPIYTVVPMYFGEIAPPNIRGTLITTMTIATKLGGLISYAMGPFLSIRDFALISATMPVLSFLSFFWLPETPYYLMRKKHCEAARISLKKLRGPKDISGEMNSIEKAIKNDLSNNTGFKEMICVPSNRKSLIIVIALTQVQQWSGSQVIIQYSQTIFDAAHADLDGQYLSIILGVIQVLCTLICVVTVDRGGRKPLLMISMLGTALCMIITGVYFFLPDVQVDTRQFTWVPVMGAMVYILMYCVGLAGIPSTLLGELFPTNVKAMATSITMCLTSIACSLVVLTFQGISSRFGIYVAFWFYAACSLVGMIFTCVYVPETKGKSLLEIQEQTLGRVSA